MDLEAIFTKSVLGAAMLASFCLPASAGQSVPSEPAEPDTSDVTWEKVVGNDGYAIGDRNLTFTDVRVSEDSRIVLSFGEEADSMAVENGSLLNLRGLQIAEGARLTLSIKKEQNDFEIPGRGYWCGASFVPSAEREGSLGIDVETDLGTLFLVGSHTDSAHLDNLSMQAGELVLGEQFHNTEGGLPPSLMIFQDTLRLYKEDRFAIGTTLERAEQKDANLLVGRLGVLIVDVANLNLSGALIEAEEGTKIEFEKDTAIFIPRPYNDDNETLELRNTGSETTDIPFFSPGVNVEGWQNLQYVNHITGKEGHLEKNEQGDLIVVEKPWMTVGVMAAPANALYKVFVSKSAPQAVNRFFNSTFPSSEAGASLLRNTLLAKSLGTTQAMSDASAGGAQFAQKAFLKNPEVLPLNVEILGGRSKGTVPGEENLINAWERETEGVALSVRGAYADWLWGVRLMYEDANVDVESNFINAAAVDAESTLLAGSLYIGKKIDRTTIVADMTVTGAEDRVDFFQAGDVKIGADEISRRSVSLGVTGLYQPIDTVAGWQPTLKAGLQVTDYLKTDYDVKLDGEKLWKVQEDNRLVATADVGVEVERSWHRYTRVPGEAEGEWRTRDDWLTLGLSGGLRARAGDIETPQTVTAAGASATIETDDLGKWEAYAGLGVDASWKDALFGVAAEGVWGPDDQEACRMRVKVVWEF